MYDVKSSLLPGGRRFNYGMLFSFATVTMCVFVRWEGVGVSSLIIIIRGDGEKTCSGVSLLFAGGRRMTTLKNVIGQFNVSIFHISLLSQPVLLLLRLWCLKCTINICENDRKTCSNRMRMGINYRKLSIGF